MNGTRTLTEAQEQLISAKVEAEYYDRQVETTINDIAFTIRHIEVKRKCYWYEPVKTLQIKANGKRTSWDKAWAMLA